MGIWSFFTVRLHLPASNDFPYPLSVFDRHAKRPKVICLRRTSIIAWLALVLVVGVVRGQGISETPDWPLFRLPPPEEIARPVNELPPVDPPPVDEATTVDEVADVEAPAEETSEDEESLERVTVPDAIWYQPTTWFVPPLWDLGFQLGLNNATGNTETFSMQAGATANRKTDEGEFDIKLRYSKGQNNGIENQNQAILNTRNEWTLGESPWSLFVTGTLEYDRFRAFDLRVATHAGPGYQFVTTEKFDLGSRFGSGFSREIGGPDNSYVPEASFGGDFEWRISETQKLTTTVDYYPDWSGFKDYRINTNTGWEVALAGPMDVSLKLSIIDRYDSTPNGRKANDLTSAVLLIWKP